MDCSTCKNYEPAIPKSAHKPGEHFNDEHDFARIVKNEIGEDEYYLTPIGTVSEGGCKIINQNINNGYREILVERKKKYRVGQIVVCKNDKDSIAETRRIKGITGIGNFGCENNQDSIKCYSPQEVRPATPAEIDQFYTVDLGNGIKVRAYEDLSIKDVFVVHLMWSDGNCITLGSKRGVALCKRAKIPIMPYSESKGEFKTPL